jgi:hypothetical protein
MSLILSCEEPVDLTKLGKYEEKIVVHSALDNLSPAEISVTYSVDAYKAKNPGLMDQALIKFYENGAERTLFFDSNSQTYFTSIIPKPGSSYSIIVEKVGFKTASASGKMPSLLDNKNVSLIPEGGKDQSGQLSDLLKIAWNDNGSEKNYYKVNFFYYSQLAQQFVPFDFAITDPSLKAYDSKKTIDGGFLFSDRLFNGKNKELTVVPPFGLVLANTTYKYLIELRNISEEYYKYQTTLQDYRDFIDFDQNPYAGGLVIYNNISNGLGIFAGTVLESDTLY